MEEETKTTKTTKTKATKTDLKLVVDGRTTKQVLTLKSLNATELRLLETLVKIIPDLQIKNTLD